MLMRRLRRLRDSVVMSFARWWWKLKLGSWAASEGRLPATEAQHWQAAEQLRVMGVHGPRHLRSGLGRYVPRCTWNYSRKRRIDTNGL